VSAPEREPIKAADLRERAKQLMPAGPRDREPLPSTFDSWGSKSERRELQKAAEFYGVGSAGGVRDRAAWPTGPGLPPAAASNRACGSPAHGSPTSFTGWHTQALVAPFR
jgi:hypothetical protein